MLVIFSHFFRIGGLYDNFYRLESQDLFGYLDSIERNDNNIFNRNPTSITIFNILVLEMFSNFSTMHSTNKYP